MKSSLFGQEVPFVCMAIKSLSLSFSLKQIYSVYFSV